MLDPVLNAIVAAPFSVLIYLIPIALTVKEPGTKTTNLHRIIGAAAAGILFLVLALLTGLGALYALALVALVLLVEAKFLFKASWKDSIAFCIAITIGAVALLIIFLPLVYLFGGYIPIYAFPQL